MEYDRYIDSPQWHTRRRKFWEEHQRRCAACGSVASIELHHMEYDPKQRGIEPDDVLLPLCGQHHDEVHALHDANSAMITLRQATIAIVEAHGGEPPPTGDVMKAPRNTDQWLADVTVACPTCGAPSSQPCVKVNAHGRRQAIRMVHKARKSAARRRPPLA